MTHQDALFEEILAHPDDDTPRLIYADFLEERGDPRAEFIRVQCELAARPADDPRRPELVDREGQLLRAHGAAWRAILPVISGVVWGEFRRGFLWSMHLMNVKTYAAVVERVSAAVPIQAVRFSQFSPRDIDALVSCPGADGLRALGVDGSSFFQASAREMSRLAKLSLVSLDLGRSNLGNRGAAAVATGKLVLLTHLDLSHNGVGDPGARALARSKSLATLGELILHHNEIGAVGARAIIDSPHLKGLHLLDLRHNDIVEPARSALRRRFGERVRL